MGGIRRLPQRGIAGVIFRLPHRKHNCVEHARTERVKTLQNRGYTRTNLRKQQKYIWFDHIEKGPLIKENGDQEKIIPITMNYDKVGERLVKKYKDILNQAPFFKNFKTITAFTNHKNLRHQLVHSKL